MIVDLKLAIIFNVSDSFLLEQTSNSFKQPLVVSFFLRLLILTHVFLPQIQIVAVHQVVVISTLLATFLDCCCCLLLFISTFGTAGCFQLTNISFLLLEILSILQLGPYKIGLVGYFIDELPPKTAMHYSFNDCRVISESNKEFQWLISFFPILNIEAICKIDSKDQVSITVKLSFYRNLSCFANCLGKPEHKKVFFMIGFLSVNILLDLFIHL